MELLQKLIAVFFLSTMITACGGDQENYLAGNIGASGSSSATSGSPVGSTAASATTINMPYQGQITDTNDGYYIYGNPGPIEGITVTNITSDVDPQIYTDATYTVRDNNWVCSAYASTNPDACYAKVAVSATPIYIKLRNFASRSSTFTLDVTAPTQGFQGAPFTITTMPYSGQIVHLASSFYAYTTVAPSIGTITATLLTSDIDIAVYTDATFTVLDPNWICTAQLGTAAETCTATAPVPSGTVLHILAQSNTPVVGVTFDLGVGP